jgi:hypothetical protein
MILVMGFIQNIAKGAEVTLFGIKYFAQLFYVYILWFFNDFHLFYPLAALPVLDYCQYWQCYINRFIR